MARLGNKKLIGRVASGRTQSGARGAKQYSPALSGAKGSAPLTQSGARRVLSSGGSAPPGAMKRNASLGLNPSRRLSNNNAPGGLKPRRIRKKPRRL